MSDPRSVEPDPSMIGGVPKAPFVRLPDPDALFVRRAARLRELAGASNLAPYLEFLATIADVQASAMRQLEVPPLPSPELMARAGKFSMPPLDRGAYKPDAGLRLVCRHIFSELAPFDKPAAAETALQSLLSADDGSLDAKMAAVLAKSVPAEELAEHVYATAALEVHFVQLASRMNSVKLVPVGVGVCPVCGGWPVVSLVVGWYGAEGARYASCMLCSTLWNEVRVKCLVCGSTKGIGYQEIDGQGGTVKAETCDECGSYVKVLYQNKDAGLDPVADDVGSLGLDRLLQDSSYRRAGSNPYLMGY